MSNSQPSYNSQSTNGHLTIIVANSAKNKLYNIEVDSETRVQELLDSFSKETLSLQYNKEVLNPRKTLSELNIQKGAKLELIQSHQGG